MLIKNTQKPLTGRPYLNGFLWIYLYLWISGLQAEVSCGPGGGHRKARWAGQEDWQSCGGVQAVLGGPESGSTGTITSWNMAHCKQTNKQTNLMLINTLCKHRNLLVFSRGGKSTEILNSCRCTKYESKTRRKSHCRKMCLLRFTHWSYLLMVK